MTRLDAIRRVVEDAEEFEYVTDGLRTQDLRDLLELYEAALTHRDAELAFAKMATGGSMTIYREIMDRPEIKSVYGAMLQAREILNATLSRLDAEVEA